MGSEGKEKVLRTISAAFENKRPISADDTMDTVEEWDSLGHLSVLTELDKAFGGKVAGIDGMSQARSVREIISLLAEAKVID